MGSGRGWGSVTVRVRAAEKRREYSSLGLHQVGYRAGGMGVGVGAGVGVGG